VLQRMEQASLGKAGSMYVHVPALSANVCVGKVPACPRYRYSYKRWRAAGGQLGSLE